MRPKRLEMEGFTSFRDQTVVDFEDADLFVLTGPTGAGKSSVIDAMTYALYGSIPRLDDRRAVAPVISRGMLQARVRLDFAVGEKHYTAARVVGNKSEARLYDEYGNTLAGSPKALSNEIERLLGIPFEHFTKSVVLPQGEFSEFLHESSGERQKMLRRLLGTELFTRLGTRARARGRDSEVAVQLLDSEVKKLEEEGITEDGLQEAHKRAEGLDSLVKCIAGRQPEIECLLQNMRSAKEDSKAIEGRLSLLAAVFIPEGAPELAEKIAEERCKLEGAVKVHGEATKERQCRHDALVKLPNETDLSLLLQRYADLAKASEERDEAASRLCEARKVLEDAQADACQAKAGVDAAEYAKRSIEDKHGAYHLARGLAPGGYCPVCRQHVSEPPEMDTPEGMEDAEAALQTAKRDHECASSRHTKGQGAEAGLKQSLKDSDSRVKDLEAKLKDAPARGEIETSLKCVEAATRALQKANEKEKQADLHLKDAQKAVKELEGDEGLAWRKYNEQRDHLAEMRPPSAEQNDLAVAWSALANWANEQTQEQNDLHQEVEKGQESAALALSELRESIAEWCSEAGVVVADGEEALTASSREQGKQKEKVKQVRKGLEDLKQRQGECKRRQREAKVAAELARYLGSRYFEQWLMEQVLSQLCVGANEELLKLSSGAYSLALDDNNSFEVIDHHNADERRPVKTLSGGETFLASLSLALALSEHLGDLAVGGAAKLEALFLDEGFGTLDSDTLDVVISAIEELGSHGRMVGVVTHVKELAESIPVRYEVTKQGNRSSIERVEA